MRFIVKQDYQKLYGHRLMYFNHENCNKILHFLAMVIYTSWRISAEDFITNKLSTKLRKEDDSCVAQCWRLVFSFCRKGSDNFNNQHWTHKQLVCNKAMHYDSRDRARLLGTSQTFDSDK